MSDAPLIVLFDARCGLCERSITWLRSRDRKGILLFAPNDGVTARLAGEPAGGEDAGLVVLEGSRRRVGAAGLARALRALGGAWALAGRALDALPRPVADAAYSWIAGNRQSVSNLCDLRPKGRLEILD